MCTIYLLFSDDDADDSEDDEGMDQSPPTRGNKLGMKIQVLLYYIRHYSFRK